ncbi:hypothetical protein [Roseitranquillus sediminis]|uniref:hypothetical protein n=1 Tax=Roseitranquillus sediminis TaxID=2809051 RepID=UPI001D0BFB30|nr:hypothetical protein [Roseitranquillus sediminis]MBM9595543.1 hypothetical protein [Roseitranquillus sediminis]
MGGICRVVEKSGYASALELIFSKQPAEYVLRINQGAGAGISATIVDADRLRPFALRQLRQAVGFLQCMFEIDLDFDEVEVFYEAEGDEDLGEGVISKFKYGLATQPLPLSFDLLARSLMAAERHDAPSFIVTLTRSARKALSEQQYINSFRYSFLLLEALYGGGKFKKEALQAALMESEEFVQLVRVALDTRLRPRAAHTSDTEELLRKSPSVSEVIKHLVEKRGFYFHGNIKRRDSWKPHDQSAAESLALFSIDIIQSISFKAAEAIFDGSNGERYFADAERVGAILMYAVTYWYSNPGEGLERTQRINIRMPGTKVVPDSAFDVANESLRLFRERHPSGHLRRMAAVVEGSSAIVFELNFAADIFRNE